MTPTHAATPTHTHTHTHEHTHATHTHTIFVSLLLSHLEHVAVFLNGVLLLLRRRASRLLRLLLLPRRVEVERVHRHGGETGRKEMGERTRGKGRERNEETTNKPKETQEESIQR